MPEKRRARATNGRRVAQRAAVQTTLNDHFSRTDTTTDSIKKAHDLHLEHTDAVPPSSKVSESQDEPRSVSAEVSSVQQDTTTSVGGNEVIDITDTSDVELSTGPCLPSAQQLTPRSELSHVTLHSLPPSLVARDVHHDEDDTSLTHAGICERARPHTAKESNKRTLASADVVPFPSSCSQHVRGLQRFYTSRQAPPRRRVVSGPRPSDAQTLDFLAHWRQPDDTPSTPLVRVCRSWTPEQCQEYLEALGRDYAKSHPVFAQICGHQERMQSRHAETWTRRFRPRRANEVLGNEQQALYLRDWLCALELRLQDGKAEERVSRCGTARGNQARGTSKRGLKRPRVVRAVTRKKKRRVDSDDDLNDFVVFSDEDERETDDAGEDSEDSATFCQRTFARLHRRGTTDTDDGHGAALDAPVAAAKHAAPRLQDRGQARFAHGLTNALLITGPPGCGKTAAVYACAEELGWEVFEVYPGIGRRNGANLAQLVGDVGRNHIVPTVHRRGPMKGPTGLEGYLARDKVSERGSGRREERGTEDEPIEVEEGSEAHEVRVLAPDRELGRSDETAISGTDGEREGPRPIVGQSLVLLEEVDILFREDAGFWPAVVEFIRGCQRPVVMTCNDAGAVPVGELALQEILVFEPCPSRVAASFLQCVTVAEGCLVPHEDLVALYEGTPWVDGEDVGEARAEGGTPDLRRSITQLQMVCAGARQGSASEKQQGDVAGGHVRRSARTISAGCRAATPAMWRAMRRASEAMSHVDAELAAGLAEEEGREGRMAGAVVGQSRGLHAAGTGPASISPAARLTGEDGRVAYRRRMADALEGVVGRGRGGVFVDYLPWVRFMVAVDDEHERRAGATGRCTRNSTRYVRAVGLGEGPRAVVRASWIR